MATDPKRTRMVQALKEILRQRPRRELQVPGRRLAAVLVPLYYYRGSYGLIFIKRSNSVAHHRGQIAFPGGGYERGDASLLCTALRESAEEIGLQPADVEVLGPLDDLLTSSSNYLVRPFVGLIPYPYTFILDQRETVALLEIPLAFLCRHKPQHEEVRFHEGRVVRSFFFAYNGQVIWGATAKILKQFLDIVEACAL